MVLDLSGKDWNQSVWTYLNSNYPYDLTELRVKISLMDNLHRVVHYVE